MKAKKKKKKMKPTTTRTMKDRRNSRSARETGNDFEVLGVANE